MRKRCIQMMLNFMIRAVIGLGLIFFINELLEIQGISVSVGLNELSFLTWNPRNTRVALLYGILFYKIL